MSLNNTAPPGTTADHITGLVLAGGAGRRMQGRDKGLVEWHGRPLVEQVVERLRPQVGRLLISCNRNLDYYKAHADDLVSDLRSDYQGPLAGIEAAAKKISSEFLVITPCDAPLLPEDLGRRLLAPLQQIGDDQPLISFAFDGEREQYLFAALKTSCLPSLSNYLDTGSRTVRGWYRELASTAVDFSDRKAGFVNLNTLD